MIKLLFDMDFCCARWMFDMDFSWDTALQQKSDVKNSPKTQPCNNKSSSKTQPCNNSRMKQQKFIPPQTQRENIMICTPHLVNSWAPVWALFLPCLILWFYMLFCILSCFVLFCILSFYLRFFFDFYVIKTLCNQKLFLWFLLLVLLCMFCFLPILSLASLFVTWTWRKLDLIGGLEATWPQFVLIQFYLVYHLEQWRERAKQIKTASKNEYPLVLEGTP